MIRLPLRHAALALAAAVAAGCASNDTRVASDTRDETTTVVRSESTHVERRATIATPTTGELVGVPACDDFLASYKACHAVIGAYAPDALDRRYDEMRSALISQSHDPEVSTTLEQRCNGLIAQRDEALAGRACLPSEAPVATTDDDDDLFDDGE
ncbi:MAG TPA: hypothetical protein VFL14_04565 [Xanthomonadales bacterium]|nr:hypothetical protein [Xanthomonadales bacterium]